MDKLTYIIGGEKIEINTVFSERLIFALRSFAPFRYVDTQETQSSPNLAMRLKISDSPQAFFSGNIIHSFDIEGGNCILMTNGTLYHFLVKEANESKMSLLMDRVSNEAELNVESLLNFNVGNLKFALWMASGFYGIPFLCSAVHSSVIVYDGKALLFLGESGTGKSTHTKLWVKHIAGSFLLNDDSPILKIENDIPVVYGSPWSGKGCCYLNEKYPIKAIIRLEQYHINMIKKLNKLEAFAALYPSFPPAFHKDEYFEEGICRIISGVISKVPIYILKCLPCFEATELVRKTIT